MINTELYQIVDEAGFKSDRGKAMLIGTAKDIMKRIDRNFQRLHISPYNKQGKMRGMVGKRGPDSRLPEDRQRGSLRRSIHWQIFNATGGDDAMIKFYTQNITSFVELAVQGDLMVDDHKGWKVKHGGLPKKITGSEYSGIDVNRVNERGKILGRKAKPFINGEIKVHGRMLFDRLIRNYGYVGNIICISALLPKHAKSASTSQAVKMSEIMGVMETHMKHMGWNPGDIGSFKLDNE